MCLGRCLNQVSPSLPSSLPFFPFFLSHFLPFDTTHDTHGYIVILLFVLLINEVIFLQTNPKVGVTTQMKALDERIQMALFVLLLKRVNFLINET